MCRGFSDTVSRGAPLSCPAVSSIVVASDGRATSAGAMRLADRLAKRDGRTPELVTVGDAATGQRARTLLDTVVDVPSDWTHTIVAGDALDALTRIDASLLVIGLNVASPPRTVIGLAASAGVPVLAAPPRITELPRTAVLAVDFGRASLRAAKLAIQLLERPAHAFMVCAGTARGPQVDVLADVFEDALALDRGVAVERRLVGGDPAAAILDVAIVERVDLIALGRHGLLTPTGIIPSRLGPVAHAILREAPCSVLVAPPD